MTPSGAPFGASSAATSAPAAVADAASPPRLRFRTADGNWRGRWEPQRAAELPVAIELSLAQPGGRTLRVVAPVGANYQ